MESPLDASIYEALQGVSKEIQAVGRSVSSKRTGTDELNVLAKALQYHAKTLRTYAKVQKDMDKDKK